MLARKRGNAPASLLRKRATARILERRDRVEERGLLTLCERSLERVDLQTLVVHRQADDLGAETREDLQRPVVRRGLDEHARASLHELLGEEDEALERTARDDDAR